MPKMHENQVIWQIEPHTQAKHVILRSYLGAWFPILNKYNGRIIYIDGFAGPGEYEGGEMGSPLIALDVAINHRMRIGGEIIFFFIEANEEKHNNLRNRIAALNIPQQFHIEIVHGQFHEELTKVLDELNSAGEVIAPTFAFIDPFGFSGLPMGLIHRLLEHPRTEVFINFPLNPVNRFAQHPNDQIAAHIVELFGTEEVLKVGAMNERRSNNLRNLYQSQLNGAARYVRFFSMYNSKNRPVYDLFFASNNSLGHYRMKEAMWRADPDGTFSFSDATNPLQTVMFVNNPAPDLLNVILQRFSGASRVLTNRILQWIQDDTPYLETHMKAALRLGEQQGHFSVYPTKQDGKRRQKGTFPTGVFIDFPVI
jgi:three-Cys-motif partner protein